LELAVRSRLGYPAPVPNTLANKPAQRFEFEKALLRQGISRIAGVDEAGRGPLAGPVVAAVLVLPRTWIEGGMPEPLMGLNDSKQLSASRRERFYELLIQNAEVEWGLAVVEAEEIDRLNILRASHEAMVRALRRLKSAPEHVLVDGLRVDSIGEPQTPIVKGDARSYSIAGASILAKVTRDRIMTEHEFRWPGFGFAVHKGYPTEAHLRALARQGPCPIHRRSFAPVAAARRQPELFPP